MRAFRKAVLRRRVRRRFLQGPTHIREHPTKGLGLCKGPFTIQTDPPVGNTLMPMSGQEGLEQQMGH
jgi:hypothetical protein